MIKLFVTFILLLVVCAAIVFCFFLLLSKEASSALMVTLRLLPFYLFAAILMTGLVHTEHMFRETRTTTILSVTLLYVLCAFIFFGWSIFIYNYDDNSYQSFYYSNVKVARNNDFALEYIFQHDRDVPTPQDGVSTNYWELSWQDNNNVPQHINIAISNKRYAKNAQAIELVDKKKIHATAPRHTQEKLLPMSKMTFDKSMAHNVEYSNLITSDYGIVMSVFSSDMFSKMTQRDKLFIQITISLLLATMVFLVGVVSSKTVLFFMMYCMRFVYLFIVYWFITNKVILLSCTIGLVVIMYVVMIRKMLRVRNAIKNKTTADTNAEKTA